MKIRFISVLITGLVVSPTVSYALNCDAILQHGLRNISIKHSTSASIATKYFQHCYKNLSKLDRKTFGSLEIEVLGYGGGGVDLSIDERRKKVLNWCKENKDTAIKNKKSYEESRPIYDKAVSAWETCNTLDALGLKTKIAITPDNQTVDIGMKYLPTGGVTPEAAVKMYNVVVNGFICSTTGPTGKNIGFPIEIRSEAINISCRRSAPTIETRASGEYNVQESGSITIQSAQNPLQLYFPQQIIPTIPLSNAQRLKGRIDKIEATVLPALKAEFEKKIIALEGRRTEIECKTGSVNSLENVKNNSSIETTVRIPKQFGKKWVVTGGACQVHNFRNAKHNVGFIKASNITNDKRGWYCRTDVVPHYNTHARDLLAKVIFCRIKYSAEKSN